MRETRTEHGGQQKLAPASSGGRPRVLVTMGDPAGIGPEVALRALADPNLTSGLEASIVGDPRVIDRWAAILSIAPAVGVIDAGIEAGAVEPGRPTENGALAALAAVERAAGLCMAEEAEAMVTAPVSKRAMLRAGVEFTGHTEHLAAMTGASGYVMTFVEGERRIALATTHLALRNVPSTVTADLILSKLVVLDGGLREWFGVRDPRIAVAALNPHAGEEGAFGDEEERVIAPAVERARTEGLSVDGPFPADSVFLGLGDRLAGGIGSQYDAVLAMYHDQGTVAAKLAGFGRSVNVTLGLPIVRTSVDHGTAFQLAGRGEADPGSMWAAIDLAAAVARRRAESA